LFLVSLFGSFSFEMTVSIPFFVAFPFEISVEVLQGLVGTPTTAPRANAMWNTCLGQFRVQVGHEHDLIAEIFSEWIVGFFLRGCRGRSR
jgi:hypothetical protein